MSLHGDCSCHACRLDVLETYLGGGGTSGKFTGSILDLIKSESRAQAQAVLKENEVRLTSPAIGHVYIQFRGQAEPATLYKGTVWANVSSMYAGRFFRAEGTVTCVYGRFPAAVRYSSSATLFNTTENEGLQDASLPNIIGAVGTQGCDAFKVHATGAFGVVNLGRVDDGYSNDANFLNRFSFSASRCSSVYGRFPQNNTSADLPIPPNETFRVWKRTA